MKKIEPMTAKEFMQTYQTEQTSLMTATILCIVIKKFNITKEQIEETKKEIQKAGFFY